MMFGIIDKVNNFGKFKFLLEEGLCGTNDDFSQC